jgi:hypothetical protein
MTMAAPQAIITFDTRARVAVFACPHCNRMWGPFPTDFHCEVFTCGPSERHPTPGQIAAASDRGCGKEFRASRAECERITAANQRTPAEERRALSLAAAEARGRAAASRGHSSGGSSRLAACDRKLAMFEAAEVERRREDADREAAYREAAYREAADIAEATRRSEAERRREDADREVANREAADIAEATRRSEADAAAKRARIASREAADIAEATRRSTADADFEGYVARATALSLGGQTDAEFDADLAATLAFSLQTAPPLHVW